MEAVDFIDKEEVPMLHVSEDACQISCFFDLRTTGDVYFATECPAKNMGQSRLAQTGRAAQKHVIKCVTPLFGCLHHQHEAFLHLALATELLKVRRQTLFVIAGRCGLRLGLEGEGQWMRVKWTR